MNVNVLKIAQIVICIMIVLLVLIQSKGQGLSSGIGSAFSMYRSRRGVERLVFILTIVFSSLLIVNSLIILVISR
jgi:preprotein translocase subunit SecG